MMQQFMEIKAANEESLLFYRMGDFYELFFKDAEIAAAALGITLTKRGKHAGEEIPMCGVPVHAAEDYLQKLIAKGYRVAVCEQTENPAEAKKRGSKSVVRREVVRLVTPGMITEEKLLDPTRSNFLATLVRVKAASGHGEFALARIDISTGHFLVLETALENLSTTLARLDPQELVLADTLYHDDEIRSKLFLDDRAITLESVSFFDSQLAEDRLKKNFEVLSLDAFGDFSRSELAAAGAALAYVEKTQIGEQPSLRAPVREDNAGTLIIDPATRANLELMQTLSGHREGSLLKAIDHTLTGPGARLLAERMMGPSNNPNLIHQRQDSIGFFLKHAQPAEHIRASLKSTPDMARCISRLSLNRGGPRDLAAIKRAIQVSRELPEIISTHTLPAELNAAIQALSSISEELLQTLDTTLGEDLPLLSRDGGFVREGYNAELDELRQLRDESKRVIANMQSDYAERTGVKSLKIKHNNVLGYFIEVTALNADPLTSEEGRETFIHRQTLANAMRFTTTELADLESRIVNAAGQALQIELRIYEELVATVLTHAHVLNRAADALSVFDVSQGLATLAEKWEYCRPTIDQSMGFEIAGGRHPVIEQVLRSEASNPFVANNCNLGGEESGQIWLLTGPNMGGKSTFLRQNALIVILAQMGSYVPASSAHIGIVDRLFSRVGAADDLARGRSTFMVEMVETAAILNQSTDRSFVILDEIGRGTATFDGLSIAWAAIEFLHEASKCRTLFATHYHELTSLAGPLERLSNATMKVREWKGDVIFLHEVIAGTADRSYGIQVAKLAGLPQAVVERARDVLDQLESGERSNTAKTLVDDLPLFSVEPQMKSLAVDSDSELINALKEISPDELSPREALQILYDLRQQALSKDN
jgi:DNA mismatch repair protein MutS